MKTMMKWQGTATKVRRGMLALSVGMSTMLMGAMTAFASSGASGPEDFVLTAEDLNPLLNSITANIKVMLKPLLIVLGVFLMIALLPRVVKKFVHG